MHYHAGEQHKPIRGGTGEERNCRDGSELSRWDRCTI